MLVFISTTELKKFNGLPPNSEITIDLGEDVQRVTYCKNCKHATQHLDSSELFKCNGCSFLRGRLVTADFFCKCGERKEKEK